MRTFTAILTYFLLQILVDEVFGVFEFLNYWPYKVIVGLFLFGLFVKHSLRYISANPPYKGVLTFFGRRLHHILQEGWRFFPFQGLAFGYELFPAGQIDYTINTKSRVSDNTEVEVEIGISYEVNTLDDDGPIKFMNAGNEKGVNNKVGETIEERVKEWLRSKMEGPQTWEQAQEAKEEGTGVILKRILGNKSEDNPDGLPKISGDIPTSILFKHFKMIAMSLTEEEQKTWKDELDKLEKDEPLKKKVLEELRERKGEIDRARQGRGKRKLSNYGVVIKRLNVVSITVLGETAKAAEDMAREKKERDAQLFETETLNLVRESIKKDNPTLSDEKVLEAAQLQIRRIAKSVTENQVTGNIPTIPLLHMGK